VLIINQHEAEPKLPCEHRQLPLPARRGPGHDQGLAGVLAAEIQVALSRFEIQEANSQVSQGLDCVFPIRGLEACAATTETTARNEILNPGAPRRPFTWMAGVLPIR
jgi:hypothetical protein